MSNYPGLLAAFEGIDNVGKTTQVQSVARQLLSQGKKVQISREMRTSIGKCFRSEFEAGKLAPRVKALLFAADRYFRLETEIIPALKQGTVVLADRWALSSLVYRSVEGQGVELADFVNKDVVPPDLTFLIDVEPGLAYHRGLTANRRSPYSEDFLRLARDRYMELVEKEKLIVIDGSQEVEQVTENIMRHLMPLLEKIK
ncbi:MAG: dTMP kinase [Chloroflexi bacterium]|nr:dTMP kinase [Chloroflexota bacterium]